MLTYGAKKDLKEYVDAVNALTPKALQELAASMMKSTPTLVSAGPRPGPFQSRGYVLFRSPPLATATPERPIHRVIPDVVPCWFALMIHGLK